jgi:hypothetical protein
MDECGLKMDQAMNEMTLFCEHSFLANQRRLGLASAARARLGMLAALLTAMALAAPSVHADGQVNDTQFDSLLAAIATGGQVTFLSTGTMVFPNPITISQDTILDASSVSYTLSGGNTGRLFKVNAGASLTLINLSLANGQADNGGAIWNDGAVLASNCTFSGNTAMGTNGNNGANGKNQTIGGNGGNGTDGKPERGGAIYNLGSLVLNYCSFTSNSANGGNGGAGGNGGDGAWQGGNGGNGGNGGIAYGGAIYNQGFAFLTNCFLTTNSCTGGSGGSGGTNGAGSLRATYPGSGGAGAAGSGAGIYNAGTIIVCQSAFAQNGCNGGASSKAGIQSNLTHGNDGTPGGTGMGGGMCNAGTATVINSTFALNFVAGADGGGGGDGSLDAFGVGGNGGNGGNGWGGGFHSSGSAALTNCTLASNGATGGGAGPKGTGGTRSGSDGGLGAGLGGNISTSGGTCSLRNCLVANSQTNLNSYGTLIDLGYNLSSDASSHFTAFGSRNATGPLLLPLAYNGGFTPTMALSPNSPANGTGGTSLSVDQRGMPRNVGNIGAYESSLTVQGGVTEGDAGLKNITLTMSGSGLTNQTSVTASNGFYSFNYLLPGTYTVSPPLGGSGFTPTNRTVTVDATNIITDAYFVANPPRLLGLTRSNLQTVAINGVGVPNQVYRLLASTNLIGWEPVRTNTANFQGTLFYSIPLSTNVPVRFFHLGPR